MAEAKLIKIEDIALNEGQIPGVKRNPREIKKDKFAKLVKSIEDNPEMLNLRELLVYEYGGKFVCIGGNMRYLACQELGYDEVPCKIIPPTTSTDKLNAYIIKDNASFGEWDWDMLANDWDEMQLSDWGVDVWQPDDNDAADEPTQEKKPVLTKEEMEQLIERSSLGSIEDYSDDTNYDFGNLYREIGLNEVSDKISAGLKDGSVHKEIAELCRMRIAQCTIFNFDEIIKFYRSKDATPVEKELLKKLYLVFITPKEALEAALLDYDNVTGKIYELEMSGNQSDETSDLEL